MSLARPGGPTGRGPGEVIALGSEPGHAPAYRRLADKATDLAEVRVEDVATARLLGAGTPAAAAALVFGDPNHPRVARYALLARQIETELPRVQAAARGLPLTAPDRATAAALWMGGFRAAVCVIPVAPSTMSGSRARGANLAVFGATTSWRARLAGQALTAALSNRTAASSARVHVDASLGDPPPSGWESLGSLELGDVVDWAVFLDGGCFANLVQRLRHLRAAGTRIFTSGMGAYADEAQDGRVDIRPHMIFDSLRDLAAAAAMEAE